MACHVSRPLKMWALAMFELERIHVFFIRHLSQNKDILSWFC
jgi:hypothetical protein